MLEKEGKNITSMDQQQQQQNNSNRNKEIPSEILIEMTVVHDIEEDGMEDVNLNEELRRERTSLVKKNKKKFTKVETFESVYYKKHLSDCGTYRKILLGFYRDHAPEKLENIRYLLNEFCTEETKLLQLVRRVEFQYNVVLLEGGHEDNDSSPQNDTNTKKKKKSMFTMPQFTAVQSKYRAGVAEFYKKMHIKTTINPSLTFPSNSSKKGLKTSSENIFFTRLESAHQSIQKILNEESNRNSFLFAPTYCPILMKEKTIKRKSFSVVEEVKKGYDKTMFRIRLQEFYRVHNPDKLKNVDVLLEKFKGKEDKLLKRIEETYKINILTNNITKTSSSLSPQTRKSSTTNINVSSTVTAKVQFI